MSLEIYLAYVLACVLITIIPGPTVTVIDVGHTPDGIRQSLASLKAIYGAENWILVVGASRDASSIGHNVLTVNTIPTAVASASIRMQDS